MRTCETCGNDFRSTSTRCPFCESHQPIRFEGKPGKTKRPAVATANLKEDQPTVEQALARLESVLATERQRGVRLVRIIHGWGSSGHPGKIKAAVLQQLHVYRHQNRIKDFVPGDDYSDHSRSGQILLAAHPKLRDSLRTDRNNPGITFVAL